MPEGAAAGARLTMSFGTAAAGAFDHVVRDSRSGRRPGQAGRFVNIFTARQRKEAEMMEEKIEKLKQWIAESGNIVFFGGAGVSTESGVPDFRSQDGLYNQQYDYPPETILSHTFFTRMPEEFFRFYKNKILMDGKKVLPNRAHYALAKLEQEGKLKAVVTQNIDGLHQDAGSREVLEVHGSCRRNHCMKCGAFYTEEEILRQMKEPVPRCPKCGGIIKPDVVLYEESLDMALMSKAIRYISQADMLIIGGTSLVVYPAAGFVDYYQGHKLVLINKSSTSRDSQADLVISDSIGKVLGEAVGV